MIIGIIAGEVFLFLMILFFAWFAITSLMEKERSAFGRSFLFLLAFIAMGACFLLFSSPLKTWLFGFIAVLVGIFFLWLLLSPTPNKSLEVMGEQKKIDERDVIFARFDHEEGSPIIQNYYKRRPEFASIDREIRELPDLLTSAHLEKDPVLFSFADSEFDFLEQLLTLVQGRKSPGRVKLSEKQNTQIVKSLIKYLGSDLCGVCPLDQAYVYSHVGRGPEVYGKEIKLDHKYAIVFAVEMDVALVSSAPKAPVIVETAKKYVEAAKISIISANFIRRLGYPARAHIAGSNYQCVLPPLGWEAGLGELGRLGILITTKYGPRVRLGLITTDLPLIPDEKKISGIQDFCEKCQKCARNCPAQAISYGDKKEDNGSLRWILNREECYRYWRKAGTDCAVCISVCPYSKPHNAFHDFIRKLASTSSSAQTLSVWGDDLFYGRIPSRRKSPLSF
jgi:ferredoxin